MQTAVLLTCLKKILSNFSFLSPLCFFSLKSTEGPCDCVWSGYKGKTHINTDHQWCWNKHYNVVYIWDRGSTGTIEAQQNKTREMGEKAGEGKKIEKILVPNEMREKWLICNLWIWFNKMRCHRAAPKPSAKKTTELKLLLWHTPNQNWKLQAAHWLVVHFTAKCWVLTTYGFNCISARVCLGFYSLDLLLWKAGEGCE